MNNLKNIAIIVLIALIAYFLYNQTGCNARLPIIIEKPKPYPVYIPKLEISDTGTVRKIYLPAKADSSAINALLAQMDSLRRKLEVAQVRSLFSMDTVTAQKDSIHIDCDEISRSIALQISFGERTVYVSTKQEVIIQMEKPKWSIGIGGGAVFALPDGQVKYGITANLQYNIFTF